MANRRSTNRGEIATLLTLGLVLVGGLVTIASSFFINNKSQNFASNSRAAAADIKNCIYTSSTTCKGENSPCEDTAQACIRCTNAVGGANKYRCPGKSDDSYLASTPANAGSAATKTPSPTKIKTPTLSPTKTQSATPTTPSSANGVPRPDMACCFCKNNSVTIYASSNARVWNDMGTECTTANYTNAGGVISYGATSWGYCNDNGGGYEGGECGTSGGGDGGEIGTKNENGYTLDPAHGYNPDKCPDTGHSGQDFYCCTQKGNFFGCMASWCDKNYSQGEQLKNCEEYTPPEQPSPTKSDGTDIDVDTTNNCTKQNTSSSKYTYGCYSLEDCSSVGEGYTPSSATCSDDTELCCKKLKSVGGAVTSTPIPTLIASCSPQTTTCQQMFGRGGDIRLTYYKSASSYCSTNPNTKMCFGLVQSKCDSYDYYSLKAKIDQIENGCRTVAQNPAGAKYSCSSYDCPTNFSGSFWGRTNNLGKKEYFGDETTCQNPNVNGRSYDIIIKDTSICKPTSPPVDLTSNVVLQPPTGDYTLTIPTDLTSNCITLKKGITLQSLTAAITNGSLNVLCDASHPTLTFTPVFTGSTFINVQCCK